MRSLILAAVLAAPLTSQTLEPGYTSWSVTPLPSGASNVLIAANGAGIVYFTGTELMLLRGGVARHLLRFPAAVFGSFTVDVGAGRVLFGESSTGDLYLVDTARPTRPRIVANLPFNYDAVASGPGTVIVSAKTGGFSAPDNELIQVDLTTGATDRIARVPGASGPVAWTNDGLFYATASASFPPPPGSTDVIHWGRAQLRSALGPGHLTAAQGFVVASGLDSASDLAIDDDFDVLVTDWANGRVFEVSRGFTGGRNGELRRSTLLDYAASMPQPSSLQLEGAQRLSPQFEPFQPAAGGTLHVVESTFGGPTRIRSIRPVRPVTAAPAAIQPGRFQVVTSGGPSNGVGFMAVGPNPVAREIGYPVNGFDQTVVWDPSMLLAWDTIAIGFDASGTATLPLFNPGVGGAAFSIGVQVAFVDAALEVIGSAAPIALNLR